MKKFYIRGDCPVRDILNRLGDKWSLLVLVTLSINGTTRFNDIQKSIGSATVRESSRIFVNVSTMAIVVCVVFGLLRMVASMYNPLSVKATGNFSLPPHLDIKIFDFKFSHSSLSN
jgi:hypothetical protein